MIRTGDAARILGSSRQHVVDLCNQGLLSVERTPTQRRLRRSEVEAFARRASSSPQLTRDQLQSLWLHGAVAGHLAIDPAGTMARAQKNLDHLRQVHSSAMSNRWLDAWQAAVDSGPDAVLEILTSRSPLATDLRQNSPFAGVLAEDERSSVLRAFRAHEHSAST